MHPSEKGAEEWPPDWEPRDFGGLVYSSESKYNPELVAGKEEAVREAED